MTSSKRQRLTAPVVVFVGGTIIAAAIAIGHGVKVGALIGEELDHLADFRLRGGLHGAGHGGVHHLGFGVG